ncbi:MAG: hypothetical protein K6E32_04515 [Lachnospiraceae bacterium]|nr:hypothetical protein [Lachnospiraceae bacterium]
MKIEVLFPEICNLYGDLQNIEYLRRSFKENGVDCEIIDTALKTEPYFASHDDMALIYMGTVTEHGQELVMDALKPYKERIRALIDAGKIFLVTGNAWEVFGEYIECDDESRIPCLGLLKTHAVRRMMQRYNSLYVGKFGDMDIVGFKSQFTHSYGEFTPLFETVRGDGLNPEVKGEGIRINNFLATYIIGPLLILNPPFTKYLMRLCGAESDKLAYEEAAMDVYTHRLEEFMQPERGLTY